MSALNQDPKRNDVRAELYQVAYDREQALQADCCLHCGAPLQITLVDVTAFNGYPQWLRGLNDGCSAQCWRDDPAGFLKSAGVPS
jgi:hypothetical protein